MQNPFENFKKHDWVIWILSVIIVATSNILTGEIQIFTLCATVIGVTALIFVAKGNVWAVSYTHLDVYKRQLQYRVHLEKIQHH